MKKDAQILKDEEFAKLSKHFQSKVEEARRILAESGNTQSFHSIMKDVLDYRQWFEFQLYYRKTGEDKKELTNNAFFTLSGGEKAMAMYVPLFSAVVYHRVYGKYLTNTALNSEEEAEILYKAGRQWHGK